MQGAKGTGPLPRPDGISSTTFANSFNTVMAHPVRPRTRFPGTWTQDVAASIMAETLPPWRGKFLKGGGGAFCPTLFWGVAKPWHQPHGNI